MVHHEALLQSILGNARLSSAHMQIFDLDAKSIGLVRELLEEARLMHVDAHTDCLATSLVHTPTTSMVKKVIAGVCDISTAQPSPVGIVRTSTGLSTTSSLTCVGSTPSALRASSGETLLASGLRSGPNEKVASPRHSPPNHDLPALATGSRPVWLFPLPDGSLLR